MIEIRRYVTPDGQIVFTEWLQTLKDARTRARIIARLNRVAAGNFGDSKSLGDGVRELRIDCGPGYRVYYAMKASSVSGFYARAIRVSSRRILQKLSGTGSTIRGDLNHEL